MIAPLMEGDAPTIELDCKDIEYVASSGLRVFLTLQKSVVAHKGNLTLKNLCPEVKDVFHMTRFDSLFNII